MYFYIIKFKGVKGYTADDEEHTYMLDEKKYEDWCNADSGTEGYQKFQVVWEGDIEDIFCENATIQNMFEKEYFVQKKYYPYG